MGRTLAAATIAVVVGILAGWMVRGASEPSGGGGPDPAAIFTTGTGEGKVIARAGAYEVTEFELRHRWEEVLERADRDFHRGRGGPKDYLEMILQEKVLSQEAAALGYLERPEIRSDLAMTLDLLVSGPLVNEEVTLKAFPEERLREYYEANPEEFEQGEQVVVRHIVVTPQAFVPGQETNATGDDATTHEEAKRKIAFLQEELDKGTAFAELAKLYSEDLTAPAGGSLGLVERGVMRPEYEAVVFDLEPGRVSEPVETEMGLHLVLVEERIEAGTIPFEDARNWIAKRLLRDDPEASRRRYQEYLEELEGRWPVEILADDEDLAALDRH